MSLQIRTATERNVTIIEAVGQITQANDSGELRDSVKNALAQGAVGILLDLGGVTYIDSTGIGELVEAWVACSRTGASLKLLHLQHRVHALLRITRLLSAFEVYDDREQALRSFELAEAVAPS